MDVIRCMLVLTKAEQNRFVNETVRPLTSQVISSYLDKLLLFKVLAVAVDKAIPNNKLQFSQMDEKVLQNNEVLEECLQSLLVYLSEYAVNSEEDVKYSTTELAEIFGVSVQTIHNWVKAGRFVGVEKQEPNQHLEISANTAWRAKNGRLYPVSDFIKDWEEDKMRQMPD